MRKLKILSLFVLLFSGYGDCSAIGLSFCIAPGDSVSSVYGHRISSSYGHRISSSYSHRISSSYSQKISRLPQYDISALAGHRVKLKSAQGVSIKRAQHPDPKSFEKQVQQVFQKVSLACVRVSKYDSTGHRRFGSFSGVIVNPDGLLLTAAHATITGESYLVELPDGRKFRATALGRMPVTDAAMIQIDTLKSKLPFCQLGWSYDLKINQACLSIAYPASLNELKNPVLRLGSVVRTVTPEGKMQTTCLMEPGDSGGPVFDLYGRVIGLHSKIETSLSMNFENPIDNYRKYWKALKKKIDYPADAYPDPEIIGTDPFQKQLAQLTGSFPSKVKTTSISADVVISSSAIAEIPLAEVSGSISPRQKNSVVGIKSTLGLVDLSAWGCVITLPDHPEAYYVVSKSSLVGDHPVLMTNGVKTLPATVLKRDAENDLVLLKAEGLDNGTLLQSGAVNLLHHNEGEFLISPSYGDSLRVGVLGNDSVEVKLMTRPFLGIMCVAPDSNTVQINGFAVHLSQQYGLQVDDIVDSLNGVRVNSAKQLNQYVSGLKPGDDAFFSLSRASKKVRIHAQIQKMPKMANLHAADSFAGGMSLRSEGFKWVFVHDSMVRPEECGGPVFDLAGNFCGINIARISRTSTLALPTSIVIDFVLLALKNQGV